MSIFVAHLVFCKFRKVKQMMLVIDSNDLLHLLSRPYFFFAMSTLHLYS